MTRPFELNITAAGKSVCIRPAEPADQSALLALINEGDPFPFSDPAGRLNLYDGGIIWVAEADGTVVGTQSGGLKQVRSGKAHALASYDFHLRVKSDWRRCGVARAMTAHNNKWLHDQGARIRFSQIAQDNKLTLRSRHMLGYREIATITYLSLRRMSDVELDLSTPECELILVNESAEWQDRVLQTFGKRDLSPTRLLDTIYATGDHSGYLGTVATRNTGELAWGSLWDKHAAMARSPLNPLDQTVFIHDIKASNAKAVRALAVGALARLPTIGRLVLVLDNFFDVPSIVDLCSQEFSIKTHIEDLLLQLGTVHGRPYLDIRD
ncbi:GNAT family N-acetyltransferase [Rhizobium rhizogenes]|uniref:GNAT family N-acetyltransferase n=1 Tax=Rhizobium rhizogenes TaxID=359 RepID=UPI001571E15E|nr:hypothetical protein [Rhizobium rhizogenes]NTF66008.1 hypothetical protein [Rhizobium rhizogenes]NTG97393.1 hypothetical protein [Rhizobium rhizogenes]